MKAMAQRNHRSTGSIRSPVRRLLIFTTWRYWWSPRSTSSPMRTWFRHHPVIHRRLPRHAACRHPHAAVTPLLEGVRITEILLNPSGDEEQEESVTLRNFSADPRTWPV